MYIESKKSPVQMYDRLLNLASTALAEVCLLTFSTNNFNKLGG